MEPLERLGRDLANPLTGDEVVRCDRLERLRRVGQQSTRENLALDSLQEFKSLV
jgi:hypothetical protein